eukprot:g3478.t1
MSDTGPGDEIWRFQAGSSDGYDFANSVTVDADGNFYLAGVTAGSLDGATVNAGGYDFAVIKISSVDGSVLWTWQDGALGDDYLAGAAATNDGGVVVGGHSNGTYNGISEGSVDFVVIKLDADGAVEWTWQEGTAEDDSINSCSIVADGNVVVTGASLGGWEGAVSGDIVAAAVKLDVTDGSVLWRYQAGATPDGVASYAATPRADGSIVLAGITDGDWDGGPFGVTDVAVVALDEDGAELWRYQVGDSGTDSQANDVAALEDGSVVIAAQTTGTLSSTSTNEGGMDFVVIKLTEAGVEEWTWQDGTTEDDTFRGVSTSLDGDSVILAGYTYGSWVQTAVGSEEDADFAGLSLGADSSLLWTYQAGTTGGNGFNGVAVRSTDGAALLAGSTNNDWVEDGTSNLWSEMAGVLVETAASAPVATPTPVSPASTSVSATAAPVSSPSSCGPTGSFHVASDLPAIAGCYQSTEASFATGSDFEVWTVSGNINVDQVAVIGNAQTEEYDATPWYLAFVPGGDDPFTVYCYSDEDAETVHPVDATWTCDLDGTGSSVPATDASVFFECGCTPTPAPTPAPTPVPASKSDGGTPMEVVIGGSVGGAVALLAIVVGVCLCCRRQAGRDSNIGAKSFPGVSGGGGRSAGKGAAAPLPPPPAYSEPDHQAQVDIGAPPAGELPPPPAYSEPPPYCG